MPTDKYRGCIAIDLGTTNSVVGYIDSDGTLVDILNMDGGLLTPSFIWLEADKSTGKVYTTVGQKAKDKMKEDPENVLCSYKTKMGADKSKEENIIKTIKSLGGKKFYAEHCSAYALAYLKKSTEEYLKSKGIEDNINQALITVPARFSEIQRDATKNSAKLAGLNVIRLLDEPSAAAYYYLYKDAEDGIPAATKNGKGKAVLVYDFGGGTFDVSLININGVFSKQVATAGNTTLGGDNIDKALAILIAKKLGYNDFNILSSKVKEKLIRLGEQAKIKISDNYRDNPVRTKSAEVDVTILHKNFRRGIDTVTITKKECFAEARPYILETIDCMNTMLNEDKNKVDEIDEVLLVGGSSKFPLVREEMIKYLNNPKFNMEYFERELIDPDLAVGYGARLYLKAILDGKDDNLKTIIPMPMGIVVTSDDGYDRFVEVIPGTQSLPMKYFSKLKSPVTNVHKGVAELIFKVQQGYSKDPTANTTLGEIHIPLTKEVADNPGSAVFNILMKVDGSGCVSIEVREIRPASHVYRETFKHYNNYSELSESFDSIGIKAPNAETSEAENSRTSGTKRKPLRRLKGKEEGNGKISSMEW